MNKFWALLFLMVPILGCATFIAGPLYDIWLPHDVSESGHAIDHLFYVILYLTGVIFVATEVFLVWSMWRYDEKTNKDPAKFVHGILWLEITWSIIPGIILLFIALYQMDSWASEKINQPRIRPTVEVTGRQFEWRFRYPGNDDVLYTEDDIYAVSDLHLPVNEDVLIVLKSADVLHSFFLPNLRVKQDAVPGMRQTVWFKSREIGKFDLVCAELCGWGHYKMKGQVTFESKEKYEKWLNETYAEQQATHKLSE